MKNEINLLCQLQELVLTRDEHRQNGDGTHTDALSNSIDEIVSKLDPSIQGLYRKLYGKNHIIVSRMFNGRCSVCSVTLPISQVQAVKQCKRIQTCPSCGRILFEEECDAAHLTASKQYVSPEARKTGISRFSDEVLMVPSLKGSTVQDAISELAEVMGKNGFVVNSESLAASALEREAILSTAVGNALAFPHVRGVEGGGLTLAMGVSREGIIWDASGEKVHLVCLSAIPLAVSAFYLRLISGIMQAFDKKAALSAVLEASSPGAMWKAVCKAVRNTVK